MKKGFTLIELLVVVLIIGILSAIAIPQFEIAIEKARASESFIVSKALLDAQKRYIQADPNRTSACTRQHVADVDLTESGGDQICSAGVTENCWQPNDFQQTDATGNTTTCESYVTRNFKYDLGCNTGTCTAGDIHVTRTDSNSGEDLYHYNLHINGRRDCEVLSDESVSEPLCTFIGNI